MLAKKYRLKKREVKAFAKSGFFNSNPVVALKIIKNRFDRPRFAVVIPSKIVKKATERNRMRRQAYEILRINLKKIRGGFDYFLILKKSDKLNFKNLEAAISALLKI
jgi:ribonuclease P protein component